MNLSDTARNRDSEIAAQDRATRALADFAETLPWNTEAAFEASRLKLLTIVREVIGKVPRV